MLPTGGRKPPEPIICSSCLKADTLVGVFLKPWKNRTVGITCTFCRKCDGLAEWPSMRGLFK